jgi:glycosyltransferase involved in cell wall biosynthesis
LRVIPLGLPPSGPIATPPIAREPLVLFVGSVFNRRRLPDLIAAFAIVAASRPELRLEIVGENRTWPYQDLEAIAARAGVAARVQMRSYVPDATLAGLYDRASVFAFLSEYEGFGLTPLEALGHGVPGVVLDTPVAREVCGSAAVFVPCGDTQAAAAAIATLLDNVGARAAVLSAAPAVLSRYQWTVTAQATLDAIVFAAGGAARG